MSTSPRLVPLNPIPGISEFHLKKPEMTIGRSRSSDVYLEDTSVSRLHAWIRVRDGAHIIEDNRSRHGVKVNGKPVERQRLADNDVIEVGVYVLKFVDAASRDSQVTTTASPNLDRMQLLLDVTRSINSSLAIREVLERVIDAVIQLTQAERGFLMTLSPKGDLEFQIGRNCDHTALESDRLSVSVSIIDRVRESGLPVVLSDIREASASMHSPSLVELGLRSVMCVPLKTNDRLIGLIYVDSQRRVKQFEESDLNLFQSLGNQAALAIEKSQLYERLQRYSVSLEEQVRDRTRDLSQANEDLKGAYRELQQAQSDIVQAEKLAAVGRLAAGIAHEINSPLGVLTSNLNMLEELARRSGESTDLLEDIEKSSAAASTRLRHIVKAFEAFTGLDEAQLKPVNLNEVIEAALTLLQHEIPSRVRVVRNFGSIGSVRCVPGRIHQAFMNLLTNAVQSIDGEGIVEIRSEQNQEAVKITVRDSGRGMTPEQRAKAFDPGFARKRDRMKASLGLVITGQIVRDHHGEIHIDSTLGVGTTVTVTFAADRR